MKRVSLLLTILLWAAALYGKDTELNARWEELPSTLAGQKVTVVKTDGTKTSGIVVQISPDGLVLQTHKTNGTIPRASVQAIKTSKSSRNRGRIIGTAIGAGIGITVIAVALTYKQNENGSNSDALVGASVGVAAAATLLGYIAGKESDKDKTTIHVIPK